MGTNKNIREAGAEWLCTQALDQLNISAFLLKEGWNEGAMRSSKIARFGRSKYSIDTSKGNAASLLTAQPKFIPH